MNKETARVGLERRLSEGIVGSLRRGNGLLVHRCEDRDERREDAAALNVGLALRHLAESLETGAQERLIDRVNVIGGGGH